MQRLVSPSYRLHVVDNKAAIAALVDSFHMKPGAAKTLKGNLNQLCGFAEVGDDREGRDETANWQRLESVQYVYRVGDEYLVPLVGKNSWKYDTIKQVDASVSRESFKKLLNKNRDSALGHGDSGAARRSKPRQRLPGVRLPHCLPTAPA